MSEPVGGQVGVFRANNGLKVKSKKEPKISYFRVLELILNVKRRDQRAGKIISSAISGAFRMFFSKLLTAFTVHRLGLSSVFGVIHRRQHDGPKKTVDG